MVKYAAEHGVKIAIENCPMILARQLAGRREPGLLAGDLARMFEIIPDDNFGLNLDPSHLVWQFIDYVRADLRVQGPHLPRPRQGHGDRPRGALPAWRDLGCGIGWQIPRLPGLGEVRWDRFISALYAVGYDYRDQHRARGPAFEGTEELVKRGFLLARNVLQPYLV